MTNNKRNIYHHKIDLSKLRISNQKPKKFCKLLEEIAYKGYEVEEISDGRKVVITKPGSKFTYGSIRREDFMVWIYDPSDDSLWLISHKDIYIEIKNKGEFDPKSTIEIIDAFERVLNGEEPDRVLKDSKLHNPCGESVESLLKAYKWIWGQEDCNYPDGKGRHMSWEGWKKESREWIKTGNGFTDLRETLANRLK